MLRAIGFIAVSLVALPASAWESPDGLISSQPGEGGAVLDAASQHFKLGVDFYRAGNWTAAGNCRPNNNSLVGVAANEDGLLGMNIVSDSNLPYSILVDPLRSDVRYSATAPPTVTGGAVASFSDTQGLVPIPTVDMDGNSRGKTQSSIGAFESAR